MNLATEPIARMQAYAPEHLVVLGVTVVAAVLLVIWARRAQDTRPIEAALRVSGWVLLAVTVLWTAWGFLPANWNVNESLPFHFSDAARFVTAVALITRAGWAIAISYFWGLTLNLQSVLTPDLNYFQLPALEFALYWFLHIAVLLAPIVLVWGLGYRPSWKGFGAAYAATALWAGIAIAVNSVTGANYAYLSRAPAGASLLDVLGPWPVYIVWEGALIAIVWALMTWPWNGRRSRSLPFADRFRLIRVDGERSLLPAA